MIVPLPKPQSKISDQTGVPTREWYNYFRSMLEAAEGNPALEAQIQAILIRLEALEDGSTDFQLIGLDSVFIAGTPANGFVKINLVNDDDSPSNTWYYGTGPDGTKGWFAVSDTIAADAGELTKTVDPVTGVTSFGLEAVADSGTGSLLAITKDGFGRVTGSKAATITGTTGNVTVVNGDAVSGLPTINLATVSNSGVGSLLAITRDGFGRVTGTKPATIAGTSSNIVVTNGDAVSGLPTVNLATVPDGGVAPTLLKVTRDSFGRVNNTQAATASDVPIAKLGSATWDNVQEAINVQNSPGLIDGGNFSDAGGGNLAYAAMHIAIRPADVDTATLYMADIAAGTITIPNDSATRFVGVQYNAGVPNVIIKTADTWDYDTEFPLGEVANLGGTLFPLFNPYKVGDPITNVIQRFDAQAYAIRSAAGGLELSTDGTTRNLAMTAGVVWTRLNDHPISARNSPTLPLFRIAPTGGTPPLSFTPGITAWPNTQYISGITITTMGNNKWANLWIFVNIGTGAWGFAHGTAEYNNSSSAASEAIPAYLTSNFLRQNIFVGRLIFEKNATTAIIESAFTRVFSTQAVSNHNQLSGLQGGTLNEYYHLTNSEHSGLTPWSSIAPSSKANDNAVVHLSGAETISGRKTVTETGTASQFIVKGDTGFNVNFILDKGMSTGFNTLLGRSVGANRWAMLFGGNEPETGGNSGSDFVVQRYDDAGNVIARALTLKRSNGEVTPGVDNSQQFGTAPLRWSELFAANGTINTSDAREKTQVRPLTLAELAAASEIGRELGVYQWLAMVEEKGESARHHIGMTVQGAISVLESHGLDPFAYGFICYDEWDELPEILSEDGDIVQEYRPAGDRYSFRMDELMAFIARGLSHRLSEVERRLDAACL